jgi:menaquinone-dependent protoporphyrinogen oxidase
MQKLVPEGDREMKMLVAVASTHGSTREIAQAVAEELRSADITVDLAEIGRETSIEGYDAVVLGSAVYLGRWLPEARKFVHTHQAALAAVPVWLFSSGPVGSGDPMPHGDPKEAAEFMAAIHARDHQNFVGKLDKRALGVGERLAVHIVGAPEGDFRDWPAIREWVRGIAESLKVPGR